MKRKQSKTSRKHTVLMIVGSVFVVSLVGGFIYFQAITHVAALLVVELESLQLSERVRSIPVPSAILLFSMGLLGLLCVRLAEKKKQARHSDIKKFGKAMN